MTMTAQAAGPNLISRVLKPQLATPADLGTLVTYCEDERWVETCKMDGHRKLVLVDDHHLTVLNRDGEPTSLPDVVAVPLAAIGGLWAFDGELIGDVLFVFDMPRACDRVTTATPYRVRRTHLEGIFEKWQPGPHVRLLPAAWDHGSKVAMAKTIIERRGEGMIFNHVDGHYRPAWRPTYRNPQIVKLKLVKDVDAWVKELGRDGKANMVLCCYDAAGKAVEIGECTALNGDGPKIKVGDVVTVRYLTWSGTRLVQPTLPRIRTDKTAGECLIGQLVVGNTKEMVE